MQLSYLPSSGPTLFPLVTSVQSVGYSESSWISAKHFWEPLALNKPIHSCKLSVIHSACNLLVLLSFFFPSPYSTWVFLILNFRFAPLAKNLYFIPETFLTQVWSCISYVEDEGNNLSQFWGMSLGPWLRFLAFSVSVWCWWMFLCQVRSCVPYWSFLAKLTCLPRVPHVWDINADIVCKAQPNSLLWPSQRSWLQVWV